jgi:hypothetical protein
MTTAKRLILYGAVPGFILGILIGNVFEAAAPLLPLSEPVLTVLAGATIVIAVGGYTIRLEVPPSETEAEPLPEPSTDS